MVNKNSKKNAPPRLPIEIEKEIYELENTIVQLYEIDVCRGDITAEDVEPDEKRLKQLENELEESYDFYNKNPIEVGSDLDKYLFGKNNNNSKSNNNNNNNNNNEALFQPKVPQESIKDSKLVEAERCVTNPDVFPGFDIDVLKNNKLHNLLVNSKLYKIYYVHWRMKVSGNYKMIPIEFLTMISSFLFYDKKMIIQSSNFKHSRLNTIYLAISGAGKSLTASIAQDFAEPLNIPVLKMSDMGTVANVRGTVKVEGNNIPIIMPGVMKNALIYADEFTSTIKEIYKNQQARSFYLDILESEEIDAGTAESKKLINILENPGSDKEIKLANKVREVMKKFQWRYDELQHRFLAKNNATMCFKGQPIDSDEDVMEKNAQLTALKGGLFGRCLFFWENDLNKTHDKIKAEKDRLAFIEKREQVTGMPEDELEQKYIDDFAKIYNSLPELRQLYISNKEISKNNIAYLYSNNDWQKLEDLVYELKKDGNPLGKRIESQMSRYQWRHYPILVYIISYLKQEQIPSSETWMQCAEIVVESVNDFKEYLENTMDLEIITKKGQIKDYTTPLLKLIQSLYKESTSNNTDETDNVNHYPNKNLFDKRFKQYFKAKISNNFNYKTYEKALHNLQDMESIKVTNVNPSTGKRFASNAYKILLWDRNKQQPRGVMNNE